MAEWLVVLRGRVLIQPVEVQVWVWINSVNGVQTVKIVLTCHLEEVVIKYNKSRIILRLLY